MMHGLEWRILLSEWVPIWKAAKLPYVRLDKIGSATVEEWCLLMDGKYSARANEALRSAQESLAGWMARWDCCSAYDLKAAMGHDGAAGPDARRPWTVDDPRLLDIMFEVAGCHETGMDTEVAMYQRPWIDARMVDGWPLEWRVFVLGGELQGVSSYYPQRALPEQYTTCANWAGFMAQRLAAEGPRDFTVDIIEPVGASPMILECGPPYTDAGGAHPCCFKGREIKGVALSLDAATDNHPAPTGEDSA